MKTPRKCIFLLLIQYTEINFDLTVSIWLSLWLQWCAIFRFDCHWSNRCLVELLMTLSFMSWSLILRLQPAVDYHIIETRLISMGTWSLQRVKCYLMIFFSPQPNVIMGGSLNRCFSWLFQGCGIWPLLNTRAVIEPWDSSWTEL